MPAVCEFNSNIKLSANVTTIPNSVLDLVKLLFCFRTADDNNK